MLLKLVTLVVVLLHFKVGLEAQINDYEYAVIVDCGSSGSRAHIFRWLKSTASHELAIKVEPARDETTNEPLIFSIKPGLSSFRDTPDQASDYMRPIMDYISEKIPQQAHLDTPVYFLGTAGLRLLTPEQQQQILDDLTNDLRFEYDFINLEAQVISGQKEAKYQWLSVNSERNRLTQEFNISDPKSFHCKSAKRWRYAIIEVGGASTQVAYETFPLLDQIVTSKFSSNDVGALQAYRKSITPVILGPNNSTNIFANTFLGLGTNSARELSVDLLVREALGTSLGSKAPIPSAYKIRGKTIELDDYCLPRGAEQEFTKPLDLLTNPNKTLGYFVEEENDSTAITVKLKGKGSHYRCRSLLNRMIHLVKQEQTNCMQEEISDGDTNDAGSCSTNLLNTPFVPFKYFQFLGLSELFYTTDEILNSVGQFYPIQITKKTSQVCATSFQDLLQKYPDANRVDSTRVLLECFKATYILSLLQTGFKMSPTFTTDFQTIDDENDWTLGALIAKLHETDR